MAAEEEERAGPTSRTVRFVSREVPGAAESPEGLLHWWLVHRLLVGVGPRPPATPRSTVPVLEGQRGGRGGRWHAVPVSGRAPAGPASPEFRNWARSPRSVPWAVTAIAVGPGGTETGTGDPGSTSCIHVGPAHTGCPCGGTSPD